MSLEEQIMSRDKYQSLFLAQMVAFVFISFKYFCGFVNWGISLEF